MKKKTDRVFDFKNWTPKSVSKMTTLEMIQKIASGNNEIRKNFIEKNLEIVTYAVDHIACVNDMKQTDIDDLMTIGIFGVDKAINSMVIALNKNRAITEGSIRKYVFLIVLKNIEHYYQQEAKHANTESYEKLVSQLEKMTDEDGIVNLALKKQSEKYIGQLNDSDDIQYYEQLKQLMYLRVLLKKSLTNVSKNELKMFFSVYPIELQSEFEIVQDVVNTDLGLREIGKKYGWTQRQTINRMSKILRKLRMTAIRCGMVASNPLNK